MKIMVNLPKQEQLEIEGIKIGVPRRSFLKHRRFCRFCREKVEFIDYKDVEILASCMTEKGRIPPRRITGFCSKHQRMITRAIKRARIMALLPFVVQ